MQWTLKYLWFYIQCPGGLGAWVQFCSHDYLQVIKSSFWLFVFPASGVTLFSTCFKKPVLCWSTLSTLNLLLSLTWGTSSAENLRDLYLEFFSFDHLHNHLKCPDPHFSCYFQLSKNLFFPLAAFNSCSRYLILPFFDILHASVIYMTYNPLTCYTLPNSDWCSHSLRASNSYLLYSSPRRWTSFSWKFWPSQRPHFVSLDPGRRLSSFWSSVGKCPVWCYPPICTWVFLVIFQLGVSN